MPKNQMIIGQSNTANSQSAKPISTLTKQMFKMFACLCVKLHVDQKVVAMLQPSLKDSFVSSVYIVLSKIAKNVSKSHKSALQCSTASAMPSRIKYAVSAT